MNYDRLIKFTNKVAIYATVALFYWVLIFLIITTFDLKIFREHITEIFYLSILAIFAVLSGAIILNVMSNLSKISSAISEARGSSAPIKKLSKKTIIAIGLSFLLVCGVLFAGNWLSAEKKKNMLISSAQSLVSENRAQLEILANYQFSKEYVKKAQNILTVIKKIDKYLPEVELIVPDVVENKKVFLGFGGHEYSEKDKEIEKHMFIYSASLEERTYLEKVFNGKEKNYKFSYRKGNYELYFPVQINGKSVVLYFSDYQRYGKFGS